MTPFTVRGVPRSLSRDAWWMAADAASGIGSNPPRPKAQISTVLIVVLLGLITLGDVSLYQVLPGIALPLYLLSVAAAAHVFCFRTVSLRSAITAWGVLIVALIPSVDLVQALSVAFALGGMLAFVAVMTGHAGKAAASAALRFPMLGVITTVLDARDFAAQPRTKSDAILASLRDWIVPGILGLVFAGIMIVANPILDQWISKLMVDQSLALPSVDRVLFWIILVPLIWPFLRLERLRPSSSAATIERRAFGKVWYLTGRSVTRALVLFNVIFAVQTLSDVAILWGDVALPEGMTYAQYAHRGAYPLLFAALLAGGFALLAQPFLQGRPVLRVLLLLWISQTALLVGSSMLRLDLYIDVYGLTRMRFLAFIWMAVIGGGLILMLWQTIRGFGPGWLMSRAGELALIATYAVALINVDGLLARHNLGHGSLTDFGREMDAYYVCGLGEGAAVAIMSYEAETGYQLCSGSYGRPEVVEPSDWREWGYRNARLRSNLAQIKGAKP